MKEAQKRADRTACIGNRARGQPGGGRTHKKVHILQTGLINGSFATPQQCQKRTRRIDVAPESSG